MQPERNDSARGIGPSNRIQIVIGDAGRITVLEIELDQGARIRSITAHDSAQLMSGAYEHTIIDGSEQDCYSNWFGALAHGALVEDD